MEGMGIRMLRPIQIVIFDVPGRVLRKPPPWANAALRPLAREQPFPGGRALPWLKGEAPKGVERGLNRFNLQS